MSAAFSGPALDDPRVQGVDACLGLRQRYARGEPRDLLVVLAVRRSSAALLVGERERDPEPHVRVEEGERLGQHADDRVELVVQPQLASDDAVDAAGLTLGERVAQNRDAVRARACHRPRGTAVPRAAPASQHA